MFYLHMIRWFLCLRSDPACAEVLASSSSSFLPPLYYPSRGADELLADVSFSDSLYTSPHSQGVSRLPLMVAMFALNGSFLGLHDVSQQLLICRDLPPRYQDAWKVGVQYEVDCLVGVASLSSSHLTFLDLCIRSLIYRLCTVVTESESYSITSYRLAGQVGRVTFSPSSTQGLCGG
jgi:hypothetical protein